MLSLLLLEFLGFILRSMSRKNVPEKEQNWQRLGIFWILLERVCISQSVSQSLNMSVNKSVSQPIITR